MSIHAIRYAEEFLAVQKSPPELLAAAYRALEITQATIQELAFLDPLDPPPGWGAAAQHAAKAHGALARAPSIRWPLFSPPPVAVIAAAEIAAVIDALIELLDTLVLVLVETAAQVTRPDDEACCLEAALHSNDLREALHRSRNTGHRTEKP